MIENIFVGVLCVVVAGVGIFGWWLDNGSTFKNKKTEENDKKVF